MKHFFTTLTVFLAFICNAQTYYQSKILLADGQSKEGYAEMPQNNLFDGAIKFREDKKGKTTSIKNDDIERISYYIENGNEYHFERTSMLQFFGKREKITKRKTWLHIIFSTPEIAYYNQAQRYSINKDGELVSSTTDNSGTWADIPLLFKRPGEEAPAVLGALTNGATIIGKQKTFRKTAILYFKGEDELIKRIEAKEFTTDDMLKLAKAYAEYKRG